MPPIQLHSMPKLNIMSTMQHSYKPHTEPNITMLSMYPPQLSNMRKPDKLLSVRQRQQLLPEPSNVGMLTVLDSILSGVL